MLVSFVTFVRVVFVVFAVTFIHINVVFVMLTVEFVMLNVALLRSRACHSRTSSSTLKSKILVNLLPRRQVLEYRISKFQKISLDHKLESVRGL